MKELAAYARDLVSAMGVTYGDARYVETRVESIEVKNGAPRAVTSRVSRGIGIRILAEGYWGFAATSNLSRRAVAKAAREAMKIARAGQRAKGPEITLTPVTPVVADYVTPFKEDPFKVRLEEKLGILLKADKGLSGEDVGEGEAVVLPGVREKDGVCIDRRGAHRPADSADRRRRLGDGGRRRGRAGEELPAQLPRQLPVDGVRIHPRAGPPRARAEGGGGGGGATLRPYPSRGQAHHRARRRATGAPDTRVHRAPDRARPGAGDGGGIRGDELSHARQADEGFPLRLACGEHRRATRRRPRGWARSRTTTRACRRSG